jgi:hypothetical protein
MSASIFSFSWLKSEFVFIFSSPKIGLSFSIYYVASIIRWKIFRQTCRSFTYLTISRRRECQSADYGEEIEEFRAWLNRKSLKFSPEFYHYSKLSLWCKRDGAVKNFKISNSYHKRHNIQLNFLLMADARHEFYLIIRNLIE